MTWFVYRYTTSWRLWWWCSYWLLVYVAAGWTTLIDLGVVAAGQDNLNFNFLYFSLLMRTGLGPRPVPVCQLKLEARPCLCRTHYSVTARPPNTQHRRNCVPRVFAAIVIIRKRRVRTIESLQTTTTLLLLPTASTINVSKFSKLLQDNVVLAIFEERSITIMLGLLGSSAANFSHFCIFFLASIFSHFCSYFWSYLQLFFGKL